MDTISVTEDDAKIIEKQVESGRYSNAEDVVSAGLHLLQDVESETEAWLQQIPSRLAEHKRDSSSSLAIDDVFAAIEDQYREDLQALDGK